MKKSLSAYSCLTLLLSFSLHCFAEAEEYKVEKQRWTNRLTYTIPEGFCHERSPILACFETTKQQCEEAASTAVKKCISEKQNDMPDMLGSADSARWGEVIGDCVGRELFTALPMKTNNPDCQ